MDWQSFLQTPVGVLCVALLGLMVGSFLNVVIHRLPKMMDREERLYAWELIFPDKAPPEQLQGRYNLFVPRSACPHCGHQIRVVENIPVLSYLLQKGRCRGCGFKITSRYMWVEILTAIASAVVAWRFDSPFAIVLALFFTWYLIALLFIDAETSLLPDCLTLPLMWLGLFAAWYGETPEMQGVFISLRESVLGAMVGYLSLWSLYWIFKLLTGRDGMGYGDFKLLAALGAWQGVVMMPMILLVSSVCGIVFFIINRIGFGKPAPFGPYLAVAGWLTFLFGGQLAGLIGFLPN